MKNKRYARIDHSKRISRKIRVSSKNFVEKNTSQLLFVTTFPPRECGIASYAQDLIGSIKSTFDGAFDIEICALENGKHHYDDKAGYILQTGDHDSYLQLITDINSSDQIKLVVVQHEFGLFQGNEKDLLLLLLSINKPSVVIFHTVLPKPESLMQHYIQDLSAITQHLVVMTNIAKRTLMDDYMPPEEKIDVIPHGTHLVENIDKTVLKKKYNFQGRKILSTFGLLSSGKSIETTLNAMPSIIAFHPDVLFLIIGKTHPCVVEEEGEKHRKYLASLVEQLNLSGHVTFINEYVPLEILLEYLQLTDIYLFTSKDPNQSVSGTFSYAMSCGCPIISTPIPHAVEVLKKGTGFLIDFENSKQLAERVINLLNDKVLRDQISMNNLHQMSKSAWQNSAIAHIQLFKNVSQCRSKLRYAIPDINMKHLRKMTTDFGVLQFSVINRPDHASGYTVDDNARALITTCQHYRLFLRRNDLKYMNIYFNFLLYSFQKEGCFLNYIDIDQRFTEQNDTCNLEDSYGRAIWALGYLLSLKDIIPTELYESADSLFTSAIAKSSSIHSTRAMAFIIKGLYYSGLTNRSVKNNDLMEIFADRLVQMYRHEADSHWQWYESYLTYANSALPEALLYAWLTLHQPLYKTIALASFDFLISKIFSPERIKVVSNKGWMHKHTEVIEIPKGGEQPIDVAYTIIALSEFYQNFKKEDHRLKMMTAFEWFLGNNHLDQIVYNPCTGGCYDGVEDNYMNLNQGAESTISYLMARLTIETYSMPAKLNYHKTDHKIIKISMDK